MIWRSLNVPGSDSSGVANQVNRFAAATIHKTPFQSAGESRTTATAQSGGLDVIADLLRAGHFLAVGQVLGLEGQSLLQRFVTAMAQIAVDVRGVTGLIGVLQN